MELFQFEKYRFISGILVGFSSFAAVLFYRLKAPYDLKTHLEVFGIGTLISVYIYWRAWGYKEPQMLYNYLYGSEGENNSLVIHYTIQYTRMTEVSIYDGILTLTTHNGAEFLVP